MSFFFFELADNDEIKWIGWSVTVNCQGKIYIWMGDTDHFFLNMATRSFYEFIKTTENPVSDAEIVFTPMKGHCANYSHRGVLEKIAEKLNSLD